MQAPPALPHLVPFAFTRPNVAPWRPRRSSSSPKRGLRTADGTSSTSPIPSSTEPASRPRITLTALTSTVAPEPTCATTGAMGAEAYLGTVDSGLSQPVHPLRTEHQRRHLDHLRPRSADRVRLQAARRDGRTRIRAPSKSDATCTTATTPRFRPRWTAPYGWPTATTTTGMPTGRSSPSSPTAAETFARTARVGLPARRLRHGTTDSAHRRSCNDAGSPPHRDRDDRRRGSQLRFWRDGLGLVEMLDHEFAGDWPTLFDADTEVLRSVFLGDPEHTLIRASSNSSHFEGSGRCTVGLSPAVAHSRGFFLLSLERDVEPTLARLGPELGFTDGVRAHHDARAASGNDWSPWPSSRRPTASASS